MVKKKNQIIVRDKPPVAKKTVDKSRVKLIPQNISELKKLGRKI